MPNHLLDEITKHAFRDVVIGDYAVPERPDRRDISRRPPNHLLCFLAHCEDFSRIAIHRDHGRLPEHNPFLFLINKHIGRAKVNANINAKHPKVLSA